MAQIDPELLKKLARVCQAFGNECRQMMENIEGARIALGDVAEQLRTEDWRKAAEEARQVIDRVRLPH